MGSNLQFLLCLLLAMGSSLIVLGGEPIPTTTEEPGIGSPCNRINVLFYNRSENNLDVCKVCVQTLKNTTKDNNATCILLHTSTGYTCSDTLGGETVDGRCTNYAECIEEFKGGNTSTTTEPPPTTSSTPTTIVTTTVPSNATTSTTTAPTTKPTTPPPPTPTTTTHPNITTTSPTTKGTTTVAPEPHKGGDFRWGSFFGGIAFTAAMASVAYIVWRFYKARTERNYHTLTSNLI